VDLAASAGLVLEPHQVNVLDGALGERPDGRWAAFEVGVVEPRQNGKGGIITARELAGLYLFGEELQTHTAHRFDTCLEGFRRIRDLIVDTPDLSRRVRRISDSHGQESIELANPTQRLLFKARSKGSGRGFSGDVVYLDEAFYLLDLGALLPTMSARPNPQLWYLSSAPLPRIESDTLRRLSKRGRAGARGRKRSGRLAYFEWCAKVKADPKDREAWQAEVAALLDDPRARAEANPGLGYRLTNEFMDTEQAAMTADDYARERLGIYPDIEDEVGEPPAIDGGDWAACKAPASKSVGPVVLAFEVSVDRKWSAVAAASVSTVGGKHVEVVENAPGTGWVVDWLLTRQETLEPTAIVCNPSGPAGGLLAECNARGVRITEASQSEFAKASQAACDEITNHAWRHLGQPELDKAVGAALKRTSGDSFVFDRRGEVDISPFVAVTLAAAYATSEALEPFLIVT